MKIQYIGLRAKYTDGLYGTGHWEKGQVKNIEDPAISKKMLKHRDQYAEPVVEEELGAEGEEGKGLGLAGKEEETIPAVESEAKSQDDNPNDFARDTVATMNDTALIADYVKTNFNMKIDRRLSVVSARQKAIQLIDQYGVEA